MTENADDKWGPFYSISQFCLAWPNNDSKMMMKEKYVENALII